MSRLLHARLLSPNLIAKPVKGRVDDDPLDEVLAMERAREVGINAPAFRRLASHHRKHYMVMERIHGLTLVLEQLWRNISCWPILYASPSDFVGYLNWWLTECRPEFCKARTELMLEPEREHVLVHQDLAPRNMILDASGKLWLIDWGHAGFYPTYMEHFGLEARTLAMKWLGEGTWAAWWGNLRWSVFRWIAIGFSYKYNRPRRAFCVVSMRTYKYRLDKSPFSNKM
ncbi:hypothetical protein BDN70DRAFT_910079 [Pholiota conissans]|uniref:Aminoglycoside phosphotransferase domain-containing protein n=1 Tax=Pholiota conissans TaxID=109636 RepID=A0A9P6D6M6_9AGAR|nr:hypothetical protein BDN70DRAFT_910079 [Pholiota conissans]